MMSSNFLYHWYYRNAFRSAGILWLIYTMIDFLNAGDAFIHINDPYSISQKLLSLFLLVVQSAAIIASFEVKYGNISAVFLCQALLAGLNVVIVMLWPYTWFRVFYQQIPMVIIPLTIIALMLWKINDWASHVAESFVMYNEKFYTGGSCVGIKSIDNALEAEQVDLAALLQELFLVREAKQYENIDWSRVIDDMCLELVKRKERLTVSVRFLHHNHDTCNRYVFIITKILLQLEYLDLDRQMLTLLGILLRISFQMPETLMEVKACKVSKATTARLTTEQMKTLLQDLDKVPHREDYIEILNRFTPANTRVVPSSYHNKLILVNE